MKERDGRFEICDWLLRVLLQSNFKSAVAAEFLLVQENGARNGSYLYHAFRSPRSETAQSEK